MFNKKINKIIKKDPYLKEWRQKTAVCLLLINMPESGIELALTGGLDKKLNVEIYCKANNLDVEEVWKILK